MIPSGSSPGGLFFLKCFQMIWGLSPFALVQTGTDLYGETNVGFLVGAARENGDRPLDEKFFSIDNGPLYLVPHG